MRYYSGRRNIRTNNFEEWHFYTSDYQHIDTVLIFFSKKINEIYLVTTHKNVEDEEDYIDTVCNLVHDLDTEFSLKIEYIDITGIADDEKVTDMVYDRAELIKAKKNIKITWPKIK